MIATFFTIFFFALSFLIQIFIWRQRKIQNYHSFILKLYLVNFILFQIVIYLLNYFSYINLSFNLYQVLHMILLYLIILYPYLSYFTGIQVISPTLQIIKKVENSNLDGVKREEFSSVITNKEFIEDRFSDLETGNYISNSNGELALTLKGKLFLLPFYYIRIILSIKS